MTLSDLRNLGLTLSLAGETLHVSPANAITAELAEQIRSNKPALVQALRDDADWQEREAALAKIPFDWNRPAEEQAIALVRWPDGTLQAMTLQEWESYRLLVGSAPGTTPARRVNGSESATGTTSAKSGSVSSPSLFQQPMSNEP